MTRYEKENEKLRELRIKWLEFLDDFDLRTFYENAIEGQKMKIGNMSVETASESV